MPKLSRRQFTTSLTAGIGTAGGLLAWSGARPNQAGSAGEVSANSRGAGDDARKRPIVISSANGDKFGATRVAYERLTGGGDTLDAVIAGVNMNETNPEDMSVGYGGLPNEEGEVTLDSCVMHGPTMRCGAVGALSRVKTPSLVAKAVMDHTDEIFLVGEGATRFARDLGFEMTDLLTEKARKIWILWRETRSVRDSWGAGLDSPDYDKVMKEKLNGPNLQAMLDERARELGIPEADREIAVNAVIHPPTGTINCLGLNEKGEISGVTTTSGLAWKIVGRIGDSPVLGAGCYVDGEIGGGGSTGRGEENIRIAGGHTVVEMLRQGKTPTEACLEALRRVARNFKAYPDRLAKVDLSYYALRVDGAYAAASLWDKEESTGSRHQFAVNDGVPRVEDMPYLFERKRSA